MAFGNVTNLPYVRNYEEALAHWERTPQPAAKRRGSSIWDANQKPLDRDKGGNRKWHYRIERHHDGAFEICLYHTVMARYEKPEGDTRVVLYAGDSRPTSKQFMWHVLNTGFLRKETTTDGREVAVHIGYNRQLSTRLAYVDGKLDVARSTHPVMCTRVMSDEDKAQRKEVWESLQFWIHAMELRMPTFERDKVMSPGWNKSPFIKVQGGLWDTAPGDEKWADTLSEYAQAVYNSLLERAYRAGAKTWVPAPEVFRRSLMNNVLKELGVNKKSKVVELPLFMDWLEYPKGAAPY